MGVSGYGTSFPLYAAYGSKVPFACLAPPRACAVHQTTFQSAHSQGYYPARERLRQSEALASPASFSQAFKLAEAQASRLAIKTGESLLSLGCYDDGRQFA